MKPRSPFLFAIFGLVLVVFPAHYPAIANDNDGPVLQGNSPEHSSDSLKSRDIAVGDTVLVTLTGDAGVMMMHFLGQVPHESDRNLDLTIPMQVRQVGKDDVQVEYIIKLDFEPDQYRLELECTLLRRQITHEIVAAPLPHTELQDHPHTSVKSQLVRARLNIRDFDECLDHRLQLWERIGEVTK